MCALRPMATHNIRQPVETSQPSPLLSAALGPLPVSVHPFPRFDNQYRSPALGSPTFSETSSTVSPKDIFGDDHIMKKTYPSLFAKQESTPHSHSPLAATPSPVDFDESDRVPIFAPPSRQTSYDSYLSTSSEDEETATPLFLPEPNFTPNQRQPSSFSSNGFRSVSRTSPPTPVTHARPQQLAQFGGLEKSLSAVDLGVPPISSQTSTTASTSDDEQSHPIFGGKTLPPKQTQPSSPPPPSSATAPPPSFDFDFLSSTRLKTGAPRKRAETPSFTSSDTEADNYRSSASESSDAEFVPHASTSALPHPRPRRNSAGHHPHAPAGPGAMARVRGRKPRKSEPAIRRTVPAASASPAPGKDGGGTSSGASTSTSKGEGEVTICPQCPTRFVRHYDLKRHLDTVHPVCSIFDSHSSARRRNRLHAHQANLCAFFSRSSILSGHRSWRSQYGFLVRKVPKAVLAQGCPHTRTYPLSHLY